jgi:phage shock protein A
MFQRIWGYLVAAFGIKLDQFEDPDILLKQAQDEMAQAHARNREQAVQALTQKNNLQAEVDRTVKEVANLAAKAEIALKNGDRDLALQLLREKQAREQNLGTLQESLANAIKMTEQIKVALQREEERIRTKTAEAMSLKTQWKQAQIENRINQAMDKFSTAGNDAAFERAASKISNARSESSARTELAAGRLDNRIASLNDAQADSAASSELAEMEARLGLAKPAATTSTSTTPTTTAGASDVEKELQELEAKIGGGGTTPSA